LHDDLGEFRIAQDELQAALALARQIDSPYWVRSAAGWLVSTLTCAGKLEDAETVLAAELHPDIPWDTIAGRLLWGAKAELALARGDPSRALDILDRLLEVLPDPSARPVARLERARSAAFLALGRPEEAEAVLRCAREEAAWSGARPLLWRIDVDLGQLYQGMAQSDAAMRAFGDASAVIEELASAVPPKRCVRRC
jgi:tetratricopeptide (TPR) repeat protein